MRDKLESYLSGSVIGILGKISVLGGGFLTLWLLTQILSQIDYGALTTTRSIALIGGLVAQFGFKKTIIQRISELDSRTSESEMSVFAGTVTIWVIIASLAILSVLYLFTTDISSIFGKQRLKIWIPLFALLIPGIALQLIFGGVLRGREKVEYAIALEQICPWCIRVLALSIAYQFHQSITAVFISFIVSYYFPVICFLYILKPYIRFERIALDLELVRLSGFFFLSSAVSRLTSSIDIFFLSALTTLSAVGGYQIAWSISLISRAGDDVLTAIIQPRLSKYILSNTKCQLKNEYFIIKDITLILGTVAVAFVCILGRHILDLFGEYVEFYPVLIILSVGAGIINPASGPIGQVLSMDKKGRALFINSTIVLATNVFFNYILINRFNSIGAAIATVITVYFANNAIGLAQAQIYSNINLIETKVYISSLILGSLYILYAIKEIGITVPIVSSIIYLFALLLKNKANIHYLYEEIKPIV